MIVLTDNILALAREAARAILAEGGTERPVQIERIFFVVRSSQDPTLCDKKEQAGFVISGFEHAGKTFYACAA